MTCNKHDDDTYVCDEAWMRRISALVIAIELIYLALICFILIM